MFLMDEAAAIICKKAKNSEGKTVVTGTKFLRATQTYPRAFCKRASLLHKEFENTRQAGRS